MAKLSEEVQYGQEAKRILGSKVFQDAIERIENEVVKILKKSPIVGQTVTTEQQQLIMLLQVTNKFTKILKETVETGKLADKQINMEEDKRGIFR